MADARARPPASLADAVQRAASPRRVGSVLDHLLDARPADAARLEAEPDLAAAVVAVADASRFLARLVVADEASLDVLAGRAVPSPLDAASVDALVIWKRRELLRIAAADLLDELDLAAVGRQLSDLADGVLGGACRLADATDIAVIGMGKLGGRELNYSSDIDILLVGDGRADDVAQQARDVVAIASRCWRVDTTLRPEGRDGALVRSIDSYEAYWGRWAEPWELQAMLKARPAAGARRLGAQFADTAARWLWSRPFSADDLRAVRSLKSRSERAALARPAGTRDLKRAPGGIRDIEFSAQLLQLVHGRVDATLRTPTTLDALAVLAAAGYIDRTDGADLADAYVLLRTIEHRLQLDNDTRTHELPADPDAVDRLARLLGHRDDPAGTAGERFSADLRRRRSRVRTIHERLWFRPLLEAFGAIADDDGVPLRPGAAELRLSAFGFADTARTAAALAELTRGLSRTSRLMQQMLPLVLSWLALSPDPDLGLLMLRNLLTGSERRTLVSDAFREAPDAAQRACVLLGTSRLLGELLVHNPDMVERLGAAGSRPDADAAALTGEAQRAVAWRTDAADRVEALQRWKDRELLSIAARDVLDDADVRRVGRELAAVADATVQLALDEVDPQVPMAVVALGRYGGQALSYASDLDVVFVYAGDGAAAAEEATRVAQAVRRLLNGSTPASRIFVVDTDLRPEGRQGALARSVTAYDRYWRSYAEPWERLAMTRARHAAGDPAVGSALVATVAPQVWERPVTDDDLRAIRRIKARMERERIPKGEDPDFHLKLGRGSLSDVEFTVQLLQLRHGVRHTETAAAIDALVAEHHLRTDDAEALRESLRFCARTRNRLYLVTSAAVESVPVATSELTWLARSLDTSAAELRETYRRVTRRARRVTERLFYGLP